MRSPCDERHVLKCAARKVVPKEIIDRKKQPYRAPDALAFSGEGAPAYVAEAFSEGAIRAAGVFEPRAVEKLHAKLRGSTTGQFSNADNMAVVGILSTQLLHAELVARAPAPRAIELSTLIDRL